MELRKRLMGNVEEYISQHRNELIASADEVLQRLTRIARGEEKDAFGLDTSNQDKLKALELLGKTYALYTDKVQNDFSMDINVNLIEDNKKPALDGAIETEVLSVEDGE